MLVAQSCPTLCDPMYCSPSVSSVHWILQTRMPEWVAMPSPGNLPNSKTEPSSPALEADSLPSEPLGELKIYLKEVIIQWQEAMTNKIQSVSQLLYFHMKPINSRR